MMIDDLTLGVLIAATTTGAVLLGTAIHLHRVAERHRRTVQEDLDWQEKSWRRHQSEEREAEDRSAWRAERQREAEIATYEYLADQARRLDEARARMAARARDEPNSPYAGHWNVAGADAVEQNQRLQDRYRRYLNQRNTTEEERHAALRRNAMQASDNEESDAIRLVIHAATLNALAASPEPREVGKAPELAMGYGTSSALSTGYSADDSFSTGGGFGGTSFDSGSSSCSSDSGSSSCSSDSGSSSCSSD